mmetsp:Transcript_94951/g.307113  ORF Transcript_94951/g.307113 Transcript_94951/m.307113 type:complete len:216 (-) Transcript_94951:667-1314(-)
MPGREAGQESGADVQSLEVVPLLVDSIAEQEGTAVAAQVHDSAAQSVRRLLRGLLGHSVAPHTLCESSFRMLQGLDMLALNLLHGPSPLRLGPSKTRLEGRALLLHALLLQAPAAGLALELPRLLAEAPGQLQRGRGANVVLELRDLSLEPLLGGPELLGEDRLLQQLAFQDRFFKRCSGNSGPFGMPATELVIGMRLVGDSVGYPLFVAGISEV